MTKVYLEYDDRHNEPHVYDFADRDAAHKYLLEMYKYTRQYYDPKDIWCQLLDDDEGNDEYTGEYHFGGDRWRHVTLGVAEEMEERWGRIAEAIRQDRGIGRG